MSAPLATLLGHLFPAIVMAVLALVIRIHGPQGLVHGIVDWSRLDEPARKRAGRMVGNILLAVAALLGGHAVFLYKHLGDAATNRLVGVVMVGGIGALLLLMILLLLRLQAKTRKHGR